MTSSTTIDFHQSDLLAHLDALDDQALDLLGFGVIGFDKNTGAVVVRYNAHESRGSGLDRSRVIGRSLFGFVAQCMNNHLVARPFANAVSANQTLDQTLDFTFAFRMKSTPVVLRLLSSPDHATQYIAVRWDH